MYTPNDEIDFSTHLISFNPFKKSKDKTYTKINDNLIETLFNTLDDSYKDILQERKKKSIRIKNYLSSQQSSFSLNITDYNRKVNEDHINQIEINFYYENYIKSNNNVPNEAIVKEDLYSDDSIDYDIIPKVSFLYIDER